jgi:molybdopterin-guanine dinucleotide biosynthesis protein A
MGRPKAWLPFGPERLLQRVVRLVGEAAAPTVVVAAPGQALPPLPPGPILVHDLVPGEGPLRGLLAGLSALPPGTEFAFATATDVPFLRPGWIGRLEGLVGEHDLALPDCGGHLHPLAALYRVAAVIPMIESLLAVGRYRPVFLKDHLPTRLVAAEDLQIVDPGLRTLCNLNSPEDYAEALAEAGFPPAEGRDEGALPRVEIELFGIPRLRAGVSSVGVRAGTVGEALLSLGRECPVLVGPVISPRGTLAAR